MKVVLGNDLAVVSNECVANNANPGFIGAIREFNVFLPLKTTMTPKSFRKLSPDGPFENTLQH